MPDDMFVITDLCDYGMTQFIFDGILKQIIYTNVYIYLII